MGAELNSTMTRSKKDDARKPAYADVLDARLSISRELALIALATLVSFNEEPNVEFSDGDDVDLPVDAEDDVVIPLLRVSRAGNLNSDVKNSARVNRSPNSREIMCVQAQRDSSTCAVPSIRISSGIAHTLPLGARVRGLLNPSFSFFEKST